MPASLQPDTTRIVRAVLEALAAPAIAVDDSGCVVAANATAGSNLTVPLAEALGRPAVEVVASLDACVRLALGANIGGAVIVWPPAAGVDAVTIELQKADTLGRLADGISHDLVNPLGAILQLSSLIATEPGVPEDLQAPASLLRDEAERTLQLVRSTLEFARRRPPAKSRIGLAPLVRECLALAASATSSLDKRVTVSEVMPEIEADIAKLRQVILAVLLAAVESMGGTWAKSGPTAKGHLRIAGYLTETGGRYCAHLAIDDTGPVDPSRERATILDSDAVLANRDLAVAAALLDQAGGRLSYEALADGNRIVLELPLAGDPPLPRRPVNPSISAAPLSPASANVDRDRPSGPAFEAEGQTPVALVVHAPAATAGSAAAAASPASPTSPAARPGASLTVLVCDDERSIRALLARVITRGGHHAREASGGAEALAILEAEPVDLVMADQRMADMTGVDLYRAAVARRPELATRFVLMSGNAGTPELMEFATETGLQVIEKPFDLSVVTATLRRLAAG